MGYLGKAQRGGLLCRSRREPGTNRTRRKIANNFAEASSFSLNDIGRNTISVLSFAGRIIGMAGA